MKRKVTMVWMVVLLGCWGALPLARAMTPNPEFAAGVRTEAETLTKQAERVQARAEKMTGDAKAAGTEWAEAIKAQAAATVKVSAAWAAGDEAALKAARTEVDHARDAVNRASERFNVRQTQSNLAPGEKQLESLRGITPAANKPLLEAVVAARKKALSAGDLFVAAVTPEASWASVEAARDVYQQALDELELATRALTLANGRAGLAARPGASDAAIAAKIADLAKTDDAMLAATKAAREQMIQARSLERKRRAAFKELETALSKPAPVPVPAPAP